ncbi:hypothetical protein ABZT47_09225 [Sphaerisporangium sp. NPDC005289]|uniref:hypothetical protein n=1 Tax=Sphaerisporangium sp. NPDC005289 TaxID=3155247 RepID=UPI0033A34452
MSGALLQDSASDRRGVQPISLRPADLAEGCAGAALLAGAGERAAFLLGVGVALRGTAVAGDADVAQVAAGVTDLIGPDAFATHFATAAALPRPQAAQAL